jgi:shikimate kinase
MRIYLIGFMGAGKTRGGRILSEKLGLKFLDLDEWIEQEEGQSVSEIFRDRGEATFRELEAAYLRRTSGMSGIIVATGGGTPCFFENIDWMKENGFTIYLRASVETLVERLKMDKDKRPLLAGLADETLKSTIESRLLERSPFYEKAFLEVRSDGDGQVAMEELGNYLKKFLRN